MSTSLVLWVLFDSALLLPLQLALTDCPSGSSRLTGMGLLVLLGLDLLSGYGCAMFMARLTGM